MDEKSVENLVDVSGRVAAVTGGGGILCGTISRGLGWLGVKIAVLDIRLEAAQAVVDDIEESGGEAVALECNVLDKASIREAAQTTLDRFGRVDILINGAGGNKAECTTGPDMSFFDLPADAVQWVFNLNFLGTFLCSQVFGRVIAEQDQGVILNTSSMNAFRPLTKIPAYSAAKAAVSNFTRWLAVHMAQEYAPGIRVNALAPGFFLTTQNRFLLIDEETEALTPRGRTIIDHTPMGRFGDPEDLLGTALWLLSPGASFVTGIVVPVDGGFSAFSGV
jgi:NAD(P)-dependent dehydrogenase (short-subunit alcohol dehydrogenase family)